MSSMLPHIQFANILAAHAPHLLASLKEGGSYRGERLEADQRSEEEERAFREWQSDQEQPNGQA